MIQDKHFIYPHELSHDEVCARIDAILARSPNAHARFDEATQTFFPGLCDPLQGLTHGIWRWCYEYDLNPAWVMISLQRERSLLGKKADGIHDFLYAFGYVGQDGPGTRNERWNGLTPQAWLCIHQSAWIAGFGSIDAYGVKENLHPTAARWNPSHPSPIQLFKAPNVKGDLYVPCNLAEHVILTYTPHMEAISSASSILHQFSPEFE